MCTTSVAEGGTGARIIYNFKFIIIVLWYNCHELLCLLFFVGTKRNVVVYGGYTALLSQSKVLGESFFTYDGWVNYVIYLLYSKDVRDFRGSSDDV